jgi:hypothetical protein
VASTYTIRALARRFASRICEFGCRNPATQSRTAARQRCVDRCRGLCSARLHNCRQLWIDLHRRSLAQYQRAPMHQLDANGNVGLLRDFVVECNNLAIEHIIVKRNTLSHGLHHRNTFRDWYTTFVVNCSPCFHDCICIESTDLTSSDKLNVVDFSFLLLVGTFFFFCSDRRSVNSNRNAHDCTLILTKWFRFCNCAKYHAIICHFVAFLGRDYYPDGFLRSMPSIHSSFLNRIAHTTIIKLFAFTIVSREVSLCAVNGHAALAASSLAAFD